MGAVAGETIEAHVERLVLEYAHNGSGAASVSRPLDENLSLRTELSIESLSLVSLAVRLGDDLGVDVADLSLELGEVKTFGDLVRMAHALARSKDGTKNV